MHDSKASHQFGLSELLAAVSATAVFAAAYRLHPVFMLLPVLACVLALPQRRSIAASVCFLMFLLPLCVYVERERRRNDFDQHLPPQVDALIELYDPRSGESGSFSGNSVFDCPSNSANSCFDN